MRNQDQFLVRLPDGMRDELKAAADAAGRSTNAEIVARLDASLRPHESGVRPVWLPEHLWDRIESEANLTEQDPNLLILEVVERAFPPRLDFKARLLGLVREIYETGGPRTKDEHLLVDALRALTGEEVANASGEQQQTRSWTKRTPKNETPSD
ncbi:Arc family DNA-binding protein [Aureimonas ureilytica]|uniref:Arc family DNA-binding protein n=1 Tax=Aureimonas ureilytica TaxID=401562 RepID=UPI003CEABA60